MPRTGLCRVAFDGEVSAPVDADRRRAAMVGIKRASVPLICRQHTMRIQ
jgi:hypothetical protein